ncbi:restriction endonuclease subunit S [Geminisphaera colitermitum]|uniref:restriction endonuclease subunit S n=1 Tax=Geminisphaera colitermitum TaxID=1148786 RepID=UPI000158D24F|nr:restriction endonuclease subunit S [Geminisphaera colitermitum]
MKADCKSLGALCVDNVEKTGPVGREFVYVDIGSINRETKRIEDAKTLLASKAPSRAKQVLKTGDVLVSMTRPNLNAVAWVPPELDGSIGSTGFHVLRAQNTESKFLFYAVQTNSFIEAMCQKVQGALYPAVRPRDISSFCLPPFSLAQQHRIVAEIEKQFTRLDAGVTALKRVQANLKRNRAAVLKSACEGRLVPTEAELYKSGSDVLPLGLKSSQTKRQDAASTFETGEQLLARILRDRKQNWQGRGKYKPPAAPDTTTLPPLPEGWTWANIEQIGQTTTGFTPPKNNAALFGGSIPFFKPSDLDVGYNVREYRDSLTNKGAEYGRILPALSILVTCIGATIGKTGLARVQCTTNQQINALTVPNELILSQFVYWYINSPLGQRQIIDNASATTLPILNKSRFEALPVPLPPLTEQTRIVAEVERRLSVIDELETLVTANLTRATHLRQSILQQTFNEGIK